MCICACVRSHAHITDNFSLFSTFDVQFLDQNIPITDDIGEYIRMYNLHSVTGQLVLNLIHDSQYDMQIYDSSTCSHHTPVK